MSAKPKFEASTFVAIAAAIAANLAIYSPAASANDVREVAYVLNVKPFCDAYVSGFRARSEAAYAAWHQKNREVVRTTEEDPAFQAIQRLTDTQQRLTPQQLEELKQGCDELLERMLSSGSPDPRRSSPEETWKTYLSALRDSDRKLAVSCLTAEARKKFVRILQTLPSDKLGQMADSVKSIQVTAGAGEIREAIVVRRDGNAGLVYFERVGDEWKISEM